MKTCLENSKELAIEEENPTEVKMGRKIGEISVKVTESVQKEEEKKKGGVMAFGCGEQAVSETEDSSGINKRPSGDKACKFLPME